MAPDKILASFHARSWRWFAALWFASLVPLLALNPARKADDYSVQGWFTEHGLPSNKIRDIIQSRDGYLWLATSQGLARFDGARFAVFNSTTHPALHQNEFMAALEAPDGSLWFGGVEGLVRLRDGQFERFTTEHGLAHNYVRSLALTRDGTIVACTRKGFSFIRDGRITTPDGAWAKIKGVARAFLERSDGSMLLGTSTGLWRVVGDNVEQLSGTATLEGRAFFSLLETPDGTAWIGYSGGVHCLRADGTSENFGAAHGLTDTRVAAMHRDRDGNLWIAASASLYRLTRGRVEPANYPDKFKGTPLQRLFEDREGGLWVASVTGLFRLKDTAGSSIGPAQGLAEASVYSVLEASDGAYWFGLWYAGVYRYDGVRATRVPALAPLDLLRISTLAEGPDGILWIGGEAGLFRYAGGTLTNFYDRAEATEREKQIVEQPGSAMTGIAHNWVNSVTPDGAGGIWAATDGALYHGVGDTFRAYTTRDGLPGNYFESVLRSRSGDIWVTVPPHGVARLREGKWTSYYCGQDISATQPTSVIEDDAGTIWLTSKGGGLNRFKDGRWRTFTTRDGLLDDAIYAVADDKLGFLWVAFPRGIARIPLAEFAEMDAGKRTVLQPKIFNYADGLPRGEVNPAGHSNVQRSRNGQLMFATDQGIAVIDPSSVTINPLEPPVYVESLIVDGVAADLSKPVAVPPGRHSLQIDYTGISLLAPEKVAFKIRLSPLDSEWVDSGSARRMRYALLPAGNYTFQVKACNNDGVWNEVPATLTFTVRPFFYQTWWFATLVVLALIAAIAGFVWQRSRSAARQMGVLARLVDDRTHELRAAKENAEAAVLAKNDSIAALKQAQEEIAAERARFKFIFEVVPVGISLLESRNEGSDLVNPAHRQITGLTPAELNQPGAFERVTHPEDYARQRPLVQKYRAKQIDHFTIEKRYVHSDGRLVWASLTRRRFTDPATGVEQSVTTLVDITERKEAEATLAATHRELLTASRQAGMAEVATGVLHNVGNVLNSVNVSATLVLDRIHESKSANVRKLGALLEANAADLVRFLTEDPRGRRVPAYVMSLSTELEQEQKFLAEELGHLRKHIEHIKDIVAMQQSYAKVSGVSEAIPVTELVEDALRMNASALVRHGLEVVRDYRDQPLAQTERHKVMQILINLIRNAKFACDDSKRPDKRLTVRIATQADRVQIAVIDNGVGIPPENLTRIFAHGFTTRRSGHGFGLHSGALMAKELGGSLLAQSEGLGTGAVFTLELPLGQKQVSP